MWGTKSTCSGTQTSYLELNKLSSGGRVSVGVAVAPRPLNQKIVVKELWVMALWPESIKWVAEWTAALLAEHGGYVSVSICAR